MPYWHLPQVSFLIGKPIVVVLKDRTAKTVWYDQYGPGQSRLVCLRQVKGFTAPAAVQDETICLQWQVVVVASV